MREICIFNLEFLLGEYICFKRNFYRIFYILIPNNWNIKYFIKLNLNN